jgi:ankyrin repeat protein
MMETEIKKLIETKNYEGLRQALSKNPNLANEGISIDEPNSPKAHPLHRICDAVFFKRITDDEAVEIAKIFLAFGAQVNGYGLKEKKDTPLIAAASLHAENLGLYYIQNGADIHHAGCSGGTALHWAAWCGRNKLVKELIDKGSNINQKCIDFGATPLGWAVHGYKFGGDTNRHYQIECVKLLIDAGADKNRANTEGNSPRDFLDDGDTELRKILN